MLNLFKEYIGQNNLLQPNDKVLLAVSGGIDSVVMLNLFSTTDIKFAVAHYNYKLRGIESDDDEMFVRQLAHQYNVDVFVDSCNTKDYSESNGLSIQEAARELRYNWFNKVSIEHKYSLIAIAHNNDDKTETFFINLFRGAGVKGLKSIPVKRENIIRPLMFANRNQIEEYANKHKLEFREDSSNKSDDYLRNRIRHHLIPVIKELSPGVENAVNKSIDNLIDADLILDSIINEKKQQLFSLDNDNIQIDLKELLKLSPIQTWMYYLLSEFGFARNNTDAICSSIEDVNCVGHKFSSTNYELLIDRDYLLLRKIRNKSSVKEFNIYNNQNEINEPVNIIIEQQYNSPEFVFSKNSNTAYFDLEKLTFPLIIRQWEHGDRMIPFGMKGQKLISEILIDSKVDLFKKEDTYVITSGGKIIWLVGLRSSNEFKITSATKNILTMELGSF